MLIVSHGPSKYNFEVDSYSVQLMQTLNFISIGQISVSTIDGIGYFTTAFSVTCIATIFLHAMSRYGV